MIKLSQKEIAKIARLANLQIKKKDLSKYKKELSDVISFVKQLEKIDTKGVIPTSQTTGLVNVTREDRVDLTQTLSQEASLSGKDNTFNGYFVVKKVIEK